MSGCEPDDGSSILLRHPNFARVGLWRDRCIVNADQASSILVVGTHGISRFNAPEAHVEERLVEAQENAVRLRAGALHAHLCLGDKGTL